MLKKWLNRIDKAGLPGLKMSSPQLLFKDSLEFYLLNILSNSFSPRKYFVIGLPASRFSTRDEPQNTGQEIQEW